MIILKESVSFWKKTILPSYEFVELKMREQEHDMFSFCDKEKIFQLWNLEYICCLTDEILERVGKGLVLEVCAGDGQLTHWLKQRGVNILATDNFSWGKGPKSKFQNQIDAIFPVENMEALEAIDFYKPEMVIVSWISYGSDLDVKILKKQVPYFIVIGEEQHGCTGSVEFWEEYEKLGYKLTWTECDQWNLCRTDYAWKDNPISRHSSTAILKKCRVTKQ